MVMQDVLRYRGIASFLAAHAGTIEAGTPLTMRSNESPDFGIGIYVAGDKVATVALSPEDGDTRERLQERLEELYLK
jgi:hypothetical protein